MQWWIDDFLGMVDDFTLINWWGFLKILHWYICTVHTVLNALMILNWYVELWWIEFTILYWWSFEFCISLWMVSCWFHIVRSFDIDWLILNRYESILIDDAWCETVAWRMNKGGQNTTVTRYAAVKQHDAVTLWRVPSSASWQPNNMTLGNMENQQHDNTTIWQCDNMTTQQYDDVTRQNKTLTMWQPENVNW